MLRWVAVLFVLLLLVYFLPQYEWTSGLDALQAASPLPIFAAILGVALFWLVRATILWMTLRIKLSISWWSTYRISSVGSLMDLLIPARGGFFVRWILLSRSFPKAKGYCFTVLGSVLGLEGLVLLFLSLLASGVHPESFIYVLPGLLFCGATAFFILLSAPQLMKMIQGSRWEKIPLLMALLELAEKMRKPHRLFIWLSSAFLCWAVQIFVVWMSAQSLGISLSWNQCVFLLLTINLALLIPVVPGNIGTMQLVVIWTLGQMKFEGPEVMAYSILLHFIQVIPILILGSSLAPQSILELMRSVIKESSKNFQRS